MAFYRALTIKGGVNTQIGNADDLLVGAGIDSNVAQILTLGAAFATEVHVTPALTVSGLTSAFNGLLVSGTGTFNNDVVVTGIATFNNNLNQSGGSFSLQGNAQSAITTTAGGINLTAAGLMNVDSAAGAVQVGVTSATSVVVGNANAPTTIHGSALAFFNGTTPQPKQTIAGNITAIADANTRAVLHSIIDAFKSAGTGYGLVTDATT